MRFAALIFVAAVPAAAQSVPTLRPAGPDRAAAAEPTKTEDLCTVAGQVLNAVTNEPLRRATILLMRADPTRGAPPLSYSTSSDGSGAFSIQNVEPGNYRLTASRNGYVSYVYGAHGPQRPGTTLSLLRQQHLTDLTLKLTPHAVLTGRILDAEGEPVVNARVMLQSYHYVQGRKQLIMAGGTSSTNDLGEYRVFGVAPGKYYLAVMPVSTSPAFAIDRSTSAGAEEEYVTTYYPGVVDPAAATQVEVAAGATLRGLDMALSKTRTVHVKGRVIHGLSGRPNVQVMLMPRNAAAFLGVLRNSPIDASGTFDIRNVTPGSYILTATVNDGTTVRQGRLPVDVGGSGMEGLTITIAPGVNVKGRVRGDADAASLDLSSARVSLQPHEQNLLMGGQAKPDGDGSFEIKSLPPERYSLSVVGLPASAYVKSARTEHVDVLAAGLDLTNGAPDSIDIVISPRAAALNGTVENSKTGAPAPGATVVLIPQAKERQDQQSYYKNTTTDQHGAFSLTGVAPGDYKLYAWEDVDFGAYMDPEFLKPLEAKGEAVTLREGDQQTVTLKMIPVDSSEAVPH